MQLKKSLKKLLRKMAQILRQRKREEKLLDPLRRIETSALTGAGVPDLRLDLHGGDRLRFEVEIREEHDRLANLLHEAADLLQRGSALVHSRGDHVRLAVGVGRGDALAAAGIQPQL